MLQWTWGTYIFMDKYFQFYGVNTSGIAGMYGFASYFLDQIIYPTEFLHIS